MLNHKDFTPKLVSYIGGVMLANDALDILISKRKEITVLQTRSSAHLIFPPGRGQLGEIRLLFGSRGERSVTSDVDFASPWIGGCVLVS